MVVDPNSEAALDEIVCETENLAPVVGLTALQLVPGGLRERALEDARVQVVSAHDVGAGRTRSTQR